MIKNYFRILTLVVLAAVIFVACKKDDDPADNDLFVGTYNGSISYITETESKSSETGSVTVVKVGNNYNFVFSDGIPDLTGVQFRKDGDNAVSVDEDEAKYIRITASNLIIAYTKDGALWTANCDR